MTNPQTAKIALTIAGSDPSGGAGMQADLKTFHQHGIFGTSVLTLATVQNTESVSGVQTMEPAFVLSQLDTVVTDLPPAAVKTGALGTAEMIRAIASRVGQLPVPLVVDPVMVSKHGSSLIDDDAVEMMRRELVPAAFLVTPNVHEAEELAGIEIQDLDAMEQAARLIAQLGAEHVLIKTGAFTTDAVDVLLTEAGCFKFSSPRSATKHTHGTGCVLSAAITARLAMGESLLSAVSAAKAFITEAITSAPQLGSGYGPVNMHARVK